jgi:plastocyanin
MRQTVMVVLLAAAVGTGCGDSSAGNGPDPAAVAAAKAQPSGDAQSGTVGQDLSNPLRIVVVRGGTPEAGAVVSWTAAGTGASMTPRVDTTAADGISTSIWHLGSEVGTQAAQASVTGGADGAPVRFTANAQRPGGQQNGVEIKLLTSGGNRFDPASVTVPVGTKVTWTWVGGFHDVTPTGGFTGSGGPVLAPHSFSQTFNSPGTFLYFCSVHGSPTGGMRGTIVVQ